jgi:hypothetical protein
MPIDVTTVADDLAVIHDGAVAITFDGLEPDTDYTLHGQAVHTLRRPPGELLCRLTTVNDVHFGEVECGSIDDSPLGPILRPNPEAGRTRDDEPRRHRGDGGDRSPPSW